MRDKPKRGGGEFKCLHDPMANNSGYVALKREAEDREGWRCRERMSKDAVQQISDDDTTHVSQDCVGELVTESLKKSVINRKVTKSPSAVLTWVHTNTWNHPPPN